MELRSSVKALNFTKKMLFDGGERALPYPSRPQKPAPQSEPCRPLERSTPQAEGVSAAALDGMLRALSASEETHMHGCIVIRNGRVICEADFPPYSTKTWHVTHSMSKTLVGTAVGFLVDEGKLSPDERICDIFPEYCTLLTGRRMRSVTIRHLLTMTSGANFREMGALTDANWVKAFFESDAGNEPGSSFDYNSMNSHVLAAVVCKRSGQSLTEYLRPRLFEPLGFGSVAWETSPSGIEIGGWGLYVLLEDMAKLGLLYLNGGMWEGRQLLSAEWVRDAVRPHARNDHGEEYGYQLWPDTRHGLYLFNGMFGQYVICVPQLCMVVAVNAGAEHFFIQSDAYEIICRFLLHALGTSPAIDRRRLEFTLSHLESGSAVPEMTAPGFSQLLRSYVTRQMRKKPLPALPPGLAGRSYTAASNRAGVLPLILSGMNLVLTDKLKSIAFEADGDGTHAALLWHDETQTHRIPLAFDSFARFELDVHGNRFLCASRARFTTDEDDRPVLKLAVYFLESTSVRIIKIFFCEDEHIILKLSETPDALVCMSDLQATNPASLQINMDLFKDLDYLWYRIDLMCNPVVPCRPEERTEA